MLYGGIIGLGTAPLLGPPGTTRRIMKMRPQSSMRKKLLSSKSLGINAGRHIFSLLQGINPPDGEAGPTRGHSSFEADVDESPFRWNSRLWNQCERLPVTYGIGEALVTDDEVSCGAWLPMA
jgi:hypothetical protein